MIQLEPAELFPIVRQIPNHTDSNTYFVRAVIRNATTDDVLATVDLDDKGSQYFRTNWKVVWDNAISKGRYITIVTSVYTDSGFTTKSENYGDDSNTYLVQGRWDLTKFGAVGASGDGINMDDIEEAMKNVLEGQEKPEKQKDLDILNLVKLIREDVIGNLPAFPDIPKATDLSGIEKILGNLKEVLSEHINAVSEKVKTLDSSVATSMEERTKPILKEFGKELDKVVKTSKKQADFSTEKSEKVLGSVFRYALRGYKVPK